jgi:zinc protease
MSLTGIGDIIEGYDGKTAWSVNPISGNRDKKGIELEQMILTYNFYREINLDKLYQKMELKGVEKVGADDAYVIVATRGDLPSETFYFNTKTSLLVRQDTTLETPEGKTPTKNFFEDFREVDGVKIPFKSCSVLPQFEAITIFTEVKQNVAVEDTKFTKPKV